MRTVFEVEIYAMPLSVVDTQNNNNIINNNNNSNNNIVISKMINNAGKD